MPRLHEFFQHSTWDGVRSFLGEWFILAAEDYDNFLMAYSAILDLKPANNMNDIYLDISDFVVEDAVNGNPAASFDIVGRIGSEDYYNLEYCEWDYWVGFEVPAWIYSTMSENKITAACLVKMTEHGYEFEDIVHAREDMYTELQEMVEDLLHRSIMKQPPPDYNESCSDLEDEY